jgi:NAD(P)-dependent dehydrogenase (short-subunit alcohol dehydrogenase family)
MTLQPIDLSGRVAAVTGGGANGAIGHAIALGLAQFGADVLVPDIDFEGAEATAKEIQSMGRRSVAVKADMGKEADILEVFEILDREFGRIDILINNAYAGRRLHPEDVTLEAWNRVMEVCVTGYILAAREAGRRMIARGVGGSIINIGSIGGVLALGRGNYIYSIAKGAVNQFTRELAVEWAQHNIRVNAIVPAQTDAPTWRRMLAMSGLSEEKAMARFLAGIPLNRLAMPEDHAGAAVWLASDLASFVTGVILPVDGGNLAMNAGGSRIWPTD